MIDAQVCLMKLLSNECDWTLLYDDDKPTLVWIMAWCHQTTRHYLSQYWPRSMSQYGIARPQWVNICNICRVFGVAILLIPSGCVKFSYWPTCFFAWRSVVITFNPFGAETEYSVRTRSVPWLLMPWLHPSPGHCQPWHGLWRIMADNSPALGLHIQRDCERVYLNAGSCLIKCQSDLGLTLMTGILTMPPMSLPFSQSPI